MSSTATNLESLFNVNDAHGQAGFAGFGNERPSFHSSDDDEIDEDELRAMGEAANAALYRENHQAKVEWIRRGAHDVLALVARVEVLQAASGSISQEKHDEEIAELQVEKENEEARADENEILANDALIEGLEQLEGLRYELDARRSEIEKLRGVRVLNSDALLDAVDADTLRGIVDAKDIANAELQEKLTLHERALVVMHETVEKQRVELEKLHNDIARIAIIVGPPAPKKARAKKADASKLWGDK